jgi:hypothetical protein
MSKRRPGSVGPDYVEPWPGEAVVRTAKRREFTIAQWSANLLGMRQVPRRRVFAEHRRLAPQRGQLPTCALLREM